MFALLKNPRFYNVVTLLCLASMALTFLGHSPLSAPLKSMGITPSPAEAGTGVKRNAILVSGDADDAIVRAVNAIRHNPSQTTWTIGDRGNVDVRTVVTRTLGDAENNTVVTGLTYLYHGRADIRLANELGRDRWIVALHEFAHAVGIPHNTVPCSVMNPVLNGCTVTFIEGVEQLAREFNEPELLQCLWNSTEIRAWVVHHGDSGNRPGCGFIEKYRQGLIKIYAQSDREYEQQSRSFNDVTKDD